MRKRLIATGLAAAALTVALATDASANTSWQNSGYTPFGAEVDVYGGSQGWGWHVYGGSTDERIWFTVTDSCGRSETDMNGINDWQEPWGSSSMPCNVVSVTWQSHEGTTNRWGSGSAYW